MTILAKLVQRISDHPVLFIFFRSIFEHNFKAIRSAIGRELRLGEGVRTLDLGCGPGTFSSLFAGGEYVGADLNPRYVEYARRKCSGEFLLGDARRLDIPDAGFDQVLIFGLLHHLPDQDVRQVLGEVRRLLKPGGLALIIEDIPATSRLNIFGHLLKRVEQGRFIRPVEEYRRLYVEAGRIVREETLHSGECHYYLAVLTP